MHTLGRHHPIPKRKHFTKMSHFELWYTHHIFPCNFTVTVSLSSESLLGMLGRKATHSHYLTKGETKRTGHPSPSSRTPAHRPGLTGGAVSAAGARSRRPARSAVPLDGLVRLSRARPNLAPACSSSHQLGGLGQPRCVGQGQGRCDSVNPVFTMSPAEVVHGRSRLSRACANITATHPRAPAPNSTGTARSAWVHPRSRALGPMLTLQLKNSFGQESHGKHI